MEIKRFSEYSPEIAQNIRELLIELSRSGRDKGEIPEAWFKDVLSSPFHDILLAYKDNKIVGMASLSVVMGAGIRKNAYLEDFVVSGDMRGSGVGALLWKSMVDWSKEKGCNRLEFTCGKGRDAAQGFYKKHGAEIYDTNFFRFELNK